MNKKLSVLILSCAIANAETSLKDAISDAKLSFDGRIFYFDRSFDKPNTPDSKALTAGGIAKLETKEMAGAKIGAAYYGSYLLSMTQRSEGISSGLLEQTTGNNLSFLGELYFEQTIGKTSLKIGRQRLSTPLANDHDLRLLPSSYEAIVLKTDELRDNTIELGYIKRYSGFVSKYNTFKDETHIWGKRGLPYLYLQNKSIADTLVRAQYIKALDDKAVAVSDYRYVDVTYKLQSANIKAQYGSNDYKNANNSQMYGAAAELNLAKADIAAIYNKINGNIFKAVESGAMYTDWQQGYANYEPSEAVGGYVNIKPLSNASLKIGKVWVRALNNSKKDDFTESNIDF